MAKHDPRYEAPVGQLVRIKSYGQAHHVTIGQLDPDDPSTDVVRLLPPGKIGLIVGTYTRPDDKLRMPIIMIDDVKGWIFQDEYEVIDAF